MSHTIRPDSISGFNPVGRTTGTTADLEGMEFLIHCPPDLLPRSRIVSVCAITDWKDAASPQKDGWFISDFYLFHHLLSPCDHVSNNQVWLTSENPEDLVQKYKEYAHGNPRGERRIVLDEKMLPDISFGSNLRVVPRKDLLERFLNTVREQARIAQHKGEQLIILIFGHGESDTSKVIVGHESGHTPLLSMGDINRLLPRGLLVTLLITSCFSAGWLVYTDLTRSQQYLNVTGIAAAGVDKESYAWPTSTSVGRASGSLAASAILSCLINVEETSKETSLEIRDHPTYIKFSHSIFECIKDMHYFGGEQEMHFSAENDEWEMNYQRRLGLPLASYKERWESLRAIETIATAEGDEETTPILRSGNVRRYQRLRVLAEKYFAANPGPDNAGHNVALHNCLRFILRGKTDFSESEINDLFDDVTYRLGSMHEADDIRTQMGIKFPSIFDVDIYKWKEENWSRCTDLDRSTKEKLHKKHYRLIIDKHVLTRPIGVVLTYTKPTNYLALALAESGLGSEEIENKVNNACLHKKFWYRSIYKAWRGKYVAENEVVISRRRAFMETVKTLGWRVTERTE